MAAFFVMSLVTVLILKYTASLEVETWILVLGSFSASVIELISLPINDNLTIPLISAAIMTGLMAL